MSHPDMYKRKKRQKQIKDLILNFANKYSKPKPVDWARLCENMRRKAKKMPATLLEEVIALQRPAKLIELIGESDFPEDALLPIDYFLGESIAEDGERIHIPGIRIEDIEGGKTKINSELKDEDLEPLAYAIAYVLAGPTIADLIPTFSNHKMSENRQMQDRTKKPARR